MIRTATPTDAAAICAIYQHYVLNTSISFEEEPVTSLDMAQRIQDVGAELPWLVFQRDGELLGYAYASKWRVRPAYRFAVETTVYVAAHASRQKIGSQLYQTLLDALRARPQPHAVHAAIGGIALPNAASVGLHEKLGFEKVAHFKQVGWKFGDWVDVGYWELLL